jgi:hypothetical protein
VNFIKPEDIKEYVSKNPKGIAGESQKLSEMVNYFAELIVKECYEHCKGQVLDKEVADTNELTYNDAVSDCANGLLQHFGVEL